MSTYFYPGGGYKNELANQFEKTKGDSEENDASLKKEEQRLKGEQEKSKEINQELEEKNKDTKEKAEERREAQSSLNDENNKLSRDSNRRKRDLEKKQKEVQEELNEKTKSAKDKVEKSYGEYHQKIKKTMEGQTEKLTLALETLKSANKELIKKVGECIKNMPQAILPGEGESFTQICTYSGGGAKSK